MNQLNYTMTLLKKWAQENPLIIRVWIFGSRAKKLATKNSDLDVAIEIKGRVHNESPNTVMFYERTEWALALSAFSPWRLDLCRYESCPDAEDHAGLLKVKHAVDQHGILVYRAS